jgi:integrase
MKYEYDTTFTYLGRRYRVRAHSLEELYTKKANKLRDLKENVIVYDSHISVDVWADRAFDTYKHGVKGVDDMKRRYKKHISPFIGAKQLGQVRSVECQTILNNSAGMSFSHVNKLRQEMSFIFEKAVDNQMIPVNPAKKLTLPECSRGERRSITGREREHLYKVYEKDPTYLLFIIMLECGCRPEEAINLVGKDIDRKDRLLHIRGTKTKNSDRYVPIPKSLFDVISGKKGFMPIAVNRCGNKHTESSYNRLVAHLKRDINISMGCKVYRNALVPPFPLADDFVPYCLRHTYCTDLCKAGVDIRTAQKLMGHANISITADIYTHVDLEDVKSAGELLQKYKTR